MNISLFAQTESVEKILNEDGTIKAGMNGSFNASGFNLSYGKNGEPVLQKSGSQNQLNSTAVWSSVGSGRYGASAR